MTIKSSHTTPWDTIRARRGFKMMDAGDLAARQPWHGAGKTTIGTLLVRKLTEAGHRAYLLDADVLRAGLNSDLDFSDSDRTENIRRICEVAKLLRDAGVIAVVACISPLRSQRLACRKLIGSDGFVEVFVDTALT